MKDSCKRLTAGALALGAVAALGQDDVPTVSAQPDTLLFVGEAAPALPLGGTVGVLGGQGSVLGNVVTGQPYSAESITESTQMLADGNRIVHKNSARVYRDSAGRTRREQSLAGLGFWSAGEEPVAMVVIDDPVERVSYILDTRAQTARTVRQFQFEPAAAAIGSVGTAPANVAVATRTDARVVVQEGTTGGVVMRRAERAPLPEPQLEPAPFDLPLPPVAAVRVLGPGPAIGIEDRIEDLGEQVLEGVVTRGSRQTQTIPAGAIGNERPIEIVTEQWYSQELGALLLRRTFDPRFGETVYRLQSVARGEPSPELFQVPSGYRLLGSEQGIGTAFEPQAAPGARAERRVLLIRPEESAPR